MNYHEWSRPQQLARNDADDRKNLFGLFFTLKQFALKLDPTPNDGEGCSFHAFRTNNYKLHFLETATGLRLLLFTDPSAGDMRECMSHIYASLYVEHALRNAAVEPLKPFSCDAFTKALVAYAKVLSGG